MGMEWGWDGNGRDEAGIEIARRGDGVVRKWEALVEMDLYKSSKSLAIIVSEQVR